MNHPTTQPDISGVPPPPPPLNRKRLWVSLLAPPGLMILLMALLFFIVTLDLPLEAYENAMVASMAGAVLLLVLGSILFIHTIVKRFRGRSLVILILLYPLGQGMILFSVFFVGCIATLWAPEWFPPSPPPARPADNPLTAVPPTPPSFSPTPHFLPDLPVLLLQAPRHE